MSDQIIQNFYRGDTPEYNLYFTQKQTDGSSQPISVEGYTAIHSLKKNEADTDYAMQVVANGTESDPENPQGHILIEPTPEDTDIDPGTYYSDIQVSWTANGNKKVKTIEKTKVKVLADITRSA